MYSDVGAHVERDIALVTSSLGSVDSSRSGAGKKEGSTMDLGSRDAEVRMDLRDLRDMSLGEVSRAQQERR